MLVTLCYLAVDIGGSKLTAAVVDEAGVVLVRDRIATPARDVWPSLARLVRRVAAAAPSRPVACGVGCPGPVDHQLGTVSPLTIPSWISFPLARELQQLTGMTTFVDIDAKAFTLGERWCGAAIGVDNVLGVVMGSTVAGGLVVQGRLLHGRLGNAGQIGHVVVEADGRPCACGGLGCLEAYCGGLSIERETGRPPQRAPEAIVERTGLLLGRAIAAMAVLVDLELVVIGGTVALGFGEPFFDIVSSEVQRRAHLSFLEGLRVVPASLGAHAPIVGAAALARTQM